MPGSGFSSVFLNVSLKRLLLTGDHTLAREFLIDHRISV